MVLRHSLLLLLCLCQTALAVPTGEWLTYLSGEIGVITITDSTFNFQLKDGGAASGFGGPLASVREPQEGQPGRLVVGPVEGGNPPYEVIWFYPPVGSRARFFCVLEGYQTGGAAESSKPEFKLGDANVFLTREFFQQVDALPVLPEPNRDQLVALMQEALRRQTANPDEDTNTLMETFMIDEGHHPTKSREPFEAAVQKYADDTEVSRLLGELGK